MRCLWWDDTLAYMACHLPGMPASATNTPYTAAWLIYRWRCSCELVSPYANLISRALTMHVHQLITDLVSDEAIFSNWRQAGTAAAAVQHPQHQAHAAASQAKGLNASIVILDSRRSRWLCLRCRRKHPVITAHARLSSVSLFHRNMRSLLLRRNN